MTRNVDFISTNFLVTIIKSALLGSPNIKDLEAFTCSARFNCNIFDYDSVKSYSLAQSSCAIHFTTQTTPSIAKYMSQKIRSISAAISLQYHPHMRAFLQCYFIGGK